jgi:5S rRNA maturation endonuclease (ribonuclease M5)
VNPSLALVLSKCESLRKNGKGWMAKCPAHPDRTPSLAIQEGDSQPVVLTCHADCDRDDVLKGMGLSWADVCAPRQEQRGEWTPAGEAVAVYDYVDEEGHLLFQVLRTVDKQFRQRMKDPSAKSGWRWSIEGARRVPYRLPKVLEAIGEGRRVFVVEGERDVWSIEAQGEVATCNPGGAGKWRQEYNEYLTGADVVIVADKDEPGQRHARQVATHLRTVAASLVVTEAKAGKDASDHLAAGHALDELEVTARDGEEAPVDLAPDLAEFLGPTLPIEDLATIAARVDAMPSPQFLARPVWPADAYGVIGAENKAGKTWAALDLAVNKAAGNSWLGVYPCEQAGRVVVFLGEGGERKTVRRVRAVGEHYEISAVEGLPIRICHRVPQLTSDGHVAVIRAELRDHRPALVIIDPLYLAAKGAKSSSLFEMAAVLEPIQHACQEYGAALVVVHHWNKTGDGRGRDRFSGVGPAEWGRVLASVSVESRHTDSDGASSVVLAWQFIGDEIPDTELRIRRRVHAEDFDDLASPMSYSVERLADRSDTASDGGALAGEKPAVRRVWKHLVAASSPLTVAELGDLCASDETGIPLKKRTIQAALGQLRDLGRARAHSVPGSTGAFSWEVRTESTHAGMAAESETCR